MIEPGSRLALHDHDATWVTGASAVIQTIESVIAEIAATDLPVLLVGESGTGKEMFANRVHRLSRNYNKSFTRIACASMNPTSLSTELGIDPLRMAEAKASDGVTVLFDEISDLDAACQRSLLCALPDGYVGARHGVLRARVISTTTRNLDQETRAGRFRSELYYRINGVCLRLPALRDRKEDIPALAESFLSKYAAQFERERPSLSSRTMTAFMNYSWPGNIRELENVIKKIIALGDEQLALADLDAKVPGTKQARLPVNENRSLKAASRAASREAEREMIMKALTRTRWNRKRAAQELQISYKSLLYKLKQIGFEETEVN